MFKSLLVQLIAFVLAITGQGPDSLNTLPPDLQADVAAYLTQQASPAQTEASATPEADASETPEADETPGPDDGSEAEDFQIVGVLTAIDGDVWTVDGVDYTVTGAEINGSPQLGDTVKIELLRNADGAVQVKSVETESSDEDLNDADDDSDEAEDDKDDDSDEAEDDEDDEDDDSDDSKDEEHSDSGDSD